VRLIAAAREVRVQVDNHVDGVSDPVAPETWRLFCEALDELR
jgi:hypothetical protein